MIAAEGTSTIIPTSMFWEKGIPSCLSSSWHCFSTALALCSSSSLLIMGNMMASVPYTEARSKARNCVRNTSGWAKHSRMARQPRAEFSSWGSGRYEGTLSAPMSRVRTTTLLPFILRRTWLYAST